jgi:hypothetical protein
MKRILTIVLAVMALGVLSVPALALDDTTDLWDVKQGGEVTGSAIVAYTGSSLRNMFGAMEGTVEPGNAIFDDGGSGWQAKGEYNFWVTWKTLDVISLKRFTLDLLRDTPGIWGDADNRAVYRFNLYYSSTNLPAVSSDWNLIYTTGNDPIIYNGNLYSIDYTFASAFQGQYFKADFIKGSVYTSPRIGELNGYGPTSSVPEPTTMLLLGFGLAGLAAVRRFKK